MKTISVKCRGCFKSFQVFGKPTKAKHGTTLFQMVEPNHLPEHTCK